MTSLHSIRIVAKVKVGASEWTVSVRDLTMLASWERWKMCRLWTKKYSTTVRVFSFHPTRNLEDSSAESNMDYGSQTQKVSEGDSISN